MAVDSIGDSMALSDIRDFDLRRKTTRLSTIFNDKPVRVLYDVLVKIKGNYEDACACLTESALGELGGGSERGAV